MKDISRKLFGTAGIRGPYLKQVTPELAYKIGLSIATMVGAKGHVNVGYDTRVTSPLLANSISSGLMAGGVDVFMLGIVPTPVLAYSNPKTGAKNGVVVTASHNPPSDNGIKCFGPDGMEYTVDLERELEEILFNKRYVYADWMNVGRIIYVPELLNNYIDDVVGRFQPKAPKCRPKVVIDCANGSASNVTPLVLRKLGLKVLSLNSHQDGFFPGRCPEPRPDALVDLAKLVVASGAVAGFAHDGDADRLSVIAEDGNCIYNDRIIAFFAKLKLEEKKGTIVTTIDTSFAIDEVVERLGGKVVRTKLGKTHEALKKIDNVILAGEPWKIIDPDWGLWVDGIYQAAVISKILVETGLKVSELFKDIPSYPQDRFSFRVPEELKNEITARIHNKMRTVFPNYESEWDFDGLRLNMPDKSWVLVRASGTEAKIRGYCEASNKKRLKEISEKLRKIMVEEISKYRVK